jgi:DNA-binding transcriptional MerR regulator
LNKAPDAFRTISEVADELDLPQHVLRFWESRFPHIKPMKRGGGRRYYRPEDVDLLRGIRHLLYGDGYTIRGVQRILREQGVRTVQSVGQGNLSLPAPANEDSETEHITPELPFPNVAQDAQEVEYNRELEEDLQPLPSITVTMQGPRENAPLRSAPFGLSPAGPPPAASHATSSAPASPATEDQIPANVAHPAVQPARGPVDLDRLEAALAELEACRRLLARALDDE